MITKSIVIPCYNEQNTILEIVNKVDKNINESDEIIIVDDCSKDKTNEILKSLNLKNQNIKILTHTINQGKGAALQTAFKECKNEIILIQDADLEYDPDDYSNLLRPFLETDADVVYGSRFLGGAKYIRIHFFWHFIANKLLTFFCNAFANLNLTDMETGYKVFKKKALDGIKLEQKSFGIEPELTLKFSQKKLKFFEVPVSYNGRSYEQGKKIGLKDAFVALFCIIKYGIRNIF
jgi:glycosyltransferase involved in cell wall biosynthesis